MEIEQYSIKELIPYEFNNRNHSEEQVNRIANSIKEFGFNQPIVIDESNIILVGHGRLLAAQKLGLKKVPVVQLKNLSEAQKKAYRILDNKLQNDSTWSVDNLELELGFLEDEGFDLSAWGLDELRAIFPGDEPEVVEDDFDPDECDNEETFIKLGNLIELGQHRVMCGDSTDVGQVAELLNDNTPVLMVTDPPYGVNYDSRWRKEYSSGEYSSGSIDNDDRADWGDVWPLWEAPVMYVWHGGLHAHVVAESLIKNNYELRGQIIWNKSVMVFGRGHYHWKHEPCWYVVKKGETATWEGDRSQTTVWDYGNGSGAGRTGDAADDFHANHISQKPVKLMAIPIQNHTKPGAIITDAFLGSGSTLIAADQLNRICYGMEISPKYCHVIIQRYKRYCEKAGKSFNCKINGQPYIPSDL